ncbi:MAG: thioesterase family protein [Deltaproteobacteria bacterium]|nr:thioesterase family protein [Deltaproteobacteria bacterium]MBW2444724.1 thioesterase family protein [Deltaproteobacteria bacterium]
MNPTEEPELRLVHEATVAEDWIDHLGHMNVRYYHEQALRGSEVLAVEHGLGRGVCDALGGVFELRETFTRHYREQLVGAPLAVRGGVLAVRGDGLRLYLELLNPEAGERAATFVHELGLRDADAGRPLPLPEMVARSAGNAVVPWPEHGRARTLDLERVPPAPGLDEARRLGLAMRKERLLGPDDCDGETRFPASLYQDLFWGGEPVRESPIGPHLRPLPDGGKLGWATLESRGIWHELPRAGTRIQSFGAEVEITNKVTTRHMWVYDVESSALLCTSSIVNLAFDVTRRRAVEIPPDAREIFEAQYHPFFR